MNSIDKIKRKIKEIYESDPNVHINVSFSHPKLCIKNAPAVIKDIYPNIFRIEEYSGGYAKYHIIRYADLMTNQIEIIELQEDK